MNDTLYNSTKDEKRKNNRPFAPSFEPDIDFTLKQTVKDPMSITDFDNQEYATEDDVLNRMNIMSTGVTPVTTSVLVQQQTDAQNTAVAEAQRLAAAKQAAEIQAQKDAEAVAAKIKQDAEIAFAAQIQEAANKKSAELAAAAEAERQRALADQQKAAELLVVQRSAPESIAPIPGNVAMSPDLATEVGAVLSQGTTGDKAAVIENEILSSQKFIEEQSASAAASAKAVEEMAAKGEAMGVDGSSSTDTTPAKPADQLLAEAATVQSSAKDIMDAAAAEMTAAQDEADRLAAEQRYKEAQNVYNAATTVINNGGNSDDIFDQIAKFIIKTFNI